MRHTSDGQYAATMTIPGTGGNYASEVVYLTQETPGTQPESRGGFDTVSELQVHIDALPTDAVLEVDLLKPGGDPNVAGDWLLAAQEYTATGLQGILALASWNGVRIRGKSGGTAGDLDLSVTWW